MKEYDIHPYCNIFPPMTADEFNRLVEDIQENGLLEPITIYDGCILDGRNRYRACINAHVEPMFVEFDGDDPLKFVISRNLSRRHLDESQRAMVAARLANIKHGGDRKSDQAANLPLDYVSQSKGASMLNVGERTVRNARAVIDKGAPELVEKVERGEVAVSTAADIAKLEKSAQSEIVARGKDEIMRVAKEIRAERQMEKAGRRAEKETVLAQRIAALPQKKYGVIYADPEWRFEVYSRETGMDRSADNHYPTSATDDICARDVPSISADDCVLFLWATVPMLPDALRVMQAWGFTYKSHAVWAKDRIGTGYWFRNQHELLLVGTRGAIPAPVMGTQWPSLIDAPVGKHSEKPSKVYELIEAYFPLLPKIELNARIARDGWDSWGYEAPGTENAA